MAGFIGIQYASDFLQGFIRRHAQAFVEQHDAMHIAPRLAF
jgi:hypothetical protein